MRTLVRRDAERSRSPLDAAAVAALVGPVLIAGVVAVLGRAYEPSDWFVVHRAGRAMLSGDLAVYADHPLAQVGPLALVVSALPRAAFVTLVCLLFLGVTLAARRLGVPQRAILVCGSLAAIAWAISALGGHVDDQLVVLGAALMVVEIGERRRGPVGWGFVLALAGKPTGIVLAPLLLLAGWPMLLAGCLGALVVWAPFALADVGGFLRAGGGIVVVRSWSVPFMLGEPVGAAFPPWVRPAQLVGGLVLCALLARRRGPVAAAIAALAFRALLEPGAWPSYCNVPLVLAVLLTARQGPVFAVAVASWLSGWWLIAAPGPVPGLVHAGLLVALIVTVAWPRRVEAGG